MLFFFIIEQSSRVSVHDYSHTFTINDDIVDEVTINFMSLIKTLYDSKCFIYRKKKTKTN